MGCVIGALIGALLFISNNCQAEDHLYLELGAGYDRSIDKGKNPQSVIRLRYEMENPRWWSPDIVEYDHHSSFSNGRPFNSEPEDLADQLSVIWRFKIK